MWTQLFAEYMTYPCIPVKFNSIQKLLFKVSGILKNRFYYVHVHSVFYSVGFIQVVKLQAAIKYGEEDLPGAKVIMIIDWFYIYRLNLITLN